MPMLLFYVEENRYAIDIDSIVHIIPRVFLKPIPDAEDYVTGLLNLEGEGIPVIDFCQIIAQRKAHPFLHSRIILLKEDSQSERIIGLLGERVGEVVDLFPEQFSNRELYLQHVPYLDKNMTDEEGVIQYFNVKEFFRFLEKSHGIPISDTRNKSN